MNASNSYDCDSTELFFHITLPFNVVNVLHFPLYAFILYLFYQEWRPQRSFSKMPHSNYIAFHMTIMNILGILGSLHCLVNNKGNARSREDGITLMAIGWYGGIILHFLSCLDQYLAVVHPVTYIRLKQSTGMRMRHIILVLVWLVAIAGAVGFDLAEMRGVIFDFTYLALFWVSIVGGSFVVLWTLKRPRPGEKDNKGLSQTKAKAFHTILIILGVLSIKFIWGLLVTLLFMSSKLSNEGKCFIETAEWWLSIPSNLVLPVMFLLKTLK